MRATLTAFTLAMALGVAPGLALAHCSDGHAAKNDFETPPPASSSIKKPASEG